MGACTQECWLIGSGSRNTRVCWMRDLRMGKKAIRKIVVVWFAGLATFGVLANDLLHVSAPILAVELDGSETLSNVEEPVAPIPVSSFAKISEVETAKLTVVSPSSLPGQIPAAEEIQETVA